MTFSLLIAAGCSAVEPAVEATLLPTSCEDPLPIEGTFTPEAPGYIVMFRDGTDAAAETARLAGRYGFTPNFVYEAVGGFAGLLEPEAVAGIRCEPSVMIIEHDGVVTID
jgi:hypothetical protein